LPTATAHSTVHHEETSIDTMPSFWRAIQRVSGRPRVSTRRVVSRLRIV
jgi:hypothetical protein